MSKLLSEIWGEVEVCAESNAPPGSSRNAHLIESYESYIWRPDAELADEVPPGFCLSMMCINGSDGLRRFRALSWEVFPILASAGGIAILKKEGLLSSREAGTYRMSSLLFRLGGRLREHLGRTFRRTKDLYVTGSPSRQGRSHILPEGLLDPSASGDVPITPNRLCELGRQALESRLEAKHDDESWIRLGLIELSKSQPIDVGELKAEESLRIVRLGLYDLGPATESIQQEIQDEIMDRFFDSLDKHLDLPTEEFDNWFFEKLDNIVKQVSQRKRLIGTVDRKIVRQIILESVFNCYRLMADAVEFQMREFANALPIPLNAEERAMFESLYYRQPWLGNLSMSLIADRSEQFGPLGAELMSDPTSPHLQGALLRFLSVHGDMVCHKRESEAEHKRRQRSGFQEVLTSDFSEQSRSQSCEFQMIALEQRELRNALCQCNSRIEWRAEEFEPDAQSRTLTWMDLCGKCGHEEPVSISYEEAEQLLRSDIADE